MNELNSVTKYSNYHQEEAVFVHPVPLCISEYIPTGNSSSSSLWKARKNYSSETVNTGLTIRDDNENIVERITGSQVTSIHAYDIWIWLLLFTGGTGANSLVRTLVAGIKGYHYDSLLE